MLRTEGSIKVDIPESIIRVDLYCRDDITLIMQNKGDYSRLHEIVISGNTTNLSNNMINEMTGLFTLRLNAKCSVTVDIDRYRELGCPPLKIG